MLSQHCTLPPQSLEAKFAGIAKGKPQTPPENRGLAVFGPDCPLTDALDLAERCILWPPPTRRTIIGLWCGEVGLHPGEFWDIAKLLLDGEVGL